MKTVKNVSIVLLTAVVVWGAASTAQARPRRHRSRANYYSNNVGGAQLGQLGFGFGTTVYGPVLGYSDYGYRNYGYSNYGYNAYGSGYRGSCPDYDLDRVMYYRRRSQMFGNPGPYGGGSFDGSANNGNYWYWRTQEAGRGNVAWGQLYNEMYGGR